MTQIWFRTSLRRGVFCLRTLDDFFLPDFELTDGAYYHDCAKRRELAGLFCDMAGWTQQRKKSLLDLLETSEKKQADAKELRAGMKKMAEEIAKIGAGCYLGSGGADACLQDAEAAAARVPAEHADAAWLHVLLYSLICRTPFTQFAAHIQALLLCGFTPAQQQDGAAGQARRRRVISIDSSGMAFDMRWTGLPDEPVVPCRLVNPDRNSPASFRLNTPLGAREITIPAGGSLNTLFAGDVMTCLKGNIHHRLSTAMIISAENGFDRIDLRRNLLTKVQLPNGVPDDFAMGAYNELYSLRENVLHMPGQETLDNVMAVFSARESWIAVMWDGSTRSDCPEHCAEHVLAVVQDVHGMAVVTQADEMQQHELMQRMLRRFDTGDSRYAEQLRLQNGMLRLTADNRLQWEESR